MPDNEGRFVDLVIIMVVYFTTPESDTDVNTSLVRTILATSGFDALVILSPLLWARITHYHTGGDWISSFLFTSVSSKSVRFLQNVGLLWQSRFWIGLAFSSREKAITRVSEARKQDLYNPVLNFETIDVIFWCLVLLPILLSFAKLERFNPLKPPILGLYDLGKELLSGIMLAAPILGVSIMICFKQRILSSILCRSLASGMRMELYR